MAKTALVRILPLIELGTEFQTVTPSEAIANLDILHEQRRGMRRLLELPRVTEEEVLRSTTPGTDPLEILKISVHTLYPTRPTLGIYFSYYEYYVSGESWNVTCD